MHARLLHAGVEMGRQRTIDDEKFWHAPRLEGCTSEDKFALLHLLTGPKSNITGVYALVPRHAGAELGWTAEQWLHVLGRLQDRDLACYDEHRLMVWVKVWWEHHNARQTVGPKLLGRTLEQIRGIPKAWRDSFLADFLSRLTLEQRKRLDQCRVESEDTSGEGYGYPIDTASGNGQRNANEQRKLLNETTTGSCRQQPVDMSAVPPQFHDDVHRALHDALRNGSLRHDPQAVIDAMARLYRSANRPRAAYPLTMHLAKNLQPASSGA